MSKTIVFIVRPHKELRSHPDIGDWQVNEDGSPALITAADTGNEISNAAVLLHEFIEAFLCYKHGIKDADVMAFDSMWYKEQEEGKHKTGQEPGHDPRSPYRTWHIVAERFEREFISQCGMMWEKHMENLEKSCESG